MTYAAPLPSLGSLFVPAVAPATAGGGNAAPFPWMGGLFEDAVPELVETPMLRAARRAGVAGVRRLANARLTVGASVLQVVYMRATADVSGFPASTGQRELVAVTDDLVGLEVRRGSACVLAMMSEPVALVVVWRHDELLTATTRLTLELA